MLDILNICITTLWLPFFDYFDIFSSLLLLPFIITCQALSNLPSPFPTPFLQVFLPPSPSMTAILACMLSFILNTCPSHLLLLPLMKLIMIGCPYSLFTPPYIFHNALLSHIYMLRSKYQALFASLKENTSI